ncbi:MAG: hypothetical protein KGJ32_15090 [Xanthomonadaceae bacterium]|nr:hypothetical protein [Xanthomonadaceae bacterium]
MTAIPIDRKRSTGPDPRDGSRRLAIEAVGTPMVRTPGIAMRQAPGGASPSCPKSN